MSHVPVAGSLFERRYRIQSLIGQGGMGVVLAALDERTGVSCAIKLLSKQALASDNERLVREARALMLLKSPHVVRVYDVDESVEHGPYLVLEKLEGADLAQLGTTPISVARAAELLRGVCEALAEAHALGIVHRDIKPSNLFVTKLSGGGETIKVLDFGISKLTETAEWNGQPTLTSADGVLGSPQFISPEQLDRPRDVDGRTDIWSVGVVLFRLVTGTYPFAGSTVSETFSAVLRAEIPTLASRGVDAPELQAVLDRCIVRDRSRRFASAALLGAALAAVAERGVAAGTLTKAPPIVAARGDEELTTHPLAATPPPRAPRGPRASRAALVILGIAVASALVLGVRGRSARGVAADPRSTSAPIATELSPPPLPLAAADALPVDGGARDVGLATMASAPSRSRPAVRTVAPRKPAPPPKPTPSASARPSPSPELRQNPYL